VRSPQVATCDPDSMEMSKVNLLFQQLDKDGSRTISKFEISDVLDLAQNEILMDREMHIFRAYIVEHCEKNTISLWELFKRYDRSSDTKLGHDELHLMLKETIG
jgi:Ca2+-binding EF-hand superfamily protein